MNGRAIAAGVSLALLCSGCLFNSAPPPRYFAPPSTLVGADPPPADPAPAAQPIRLRRVRAASYLGEQIAWRISDVERGLYEQRRWTEAPSRYVERTLAAAVDRNPGLRRVESGRVATLDIDLVSFDSVLTTPAHADVEVVASLHNADGATLFERAFTAEQPVADDTASAAARAMGTALDDVAQQIAAETATALRPPPGKGAHCCAR